MKGNTNCISVVETSSDNQETLESVNLIYAIDKTQETINQGDKVWINYDFTEEEEVNNYTISSAHVVGFVKNNYTVVVNSSSGIYAGLYDNQFQTHDFEQVATTGISFSYFQRRYIDGELYLTQLYSSPRYNDTSTNYYMQVRASNVPKYWRSIYYLGNGVAFQSNYTYSLLYAGTANIDYYNLTQNLYSSSCSNGAGWFGYYDNNIIIIQNSLKIVYFLNTEDATAYSLTKSFTINYRLLDMTGIGEGELVFGRTNYNSYLGFSIYTFDSDLNFVELELSDEMANFHDVAVDFYYNPNLQRLCLATIDNVYVYHVDVENKTFTQIAFSITLPENTTTSPYNFSLSDDFMFATIQVLDGSGLFYVYKLAKNNEWVIYETVDASPSNTAYSGFYTGNDDTQGRKEIKTIVPDTYAVIFDQEDGATTLGDYEEVEANTDIDTSVETDESEDEETITVTLPYDPVEIEGES